MMKKKYKGLVLADLHFGAIDTEDMKYLLRANLFNVLESKMFFDYIIIAGDFWDKKIFLNDRASDAGIWLMNKLVQYTKCIRIVYGTESHEVNQYNIFNIFEGRKGLDFKIIKSVCEEELLPGLNVLYLPEEYIKDKDEYYKEYFSQKNKYDYIFGHGIIAEAMTMIKKSSSNKEDKEKRLKPATFTTADFKRCCRGQVYFGHYHVRSNIQDWVFYVGSFTRWIHGEEEMKGYYELSCDLEDEPIYSSEFHENYDAPKYKTYSFGYDHEMFTSDEMLENYLKTLTRLANSEDYKKIKYIFNIPENYSNPEFFINSMRENFRNEPKVTCEFVNGYVTKKKHTEEKVLEEIETKYDYLLNRNLSVPDVLSNYIEDTNGKKIEGEKIATYLNTDIMKLIELEMDYCKK